MAKIRNPQAYAAWLARKQMDATQHQQVKSYDQGGIDEAARQRLMQEIAKQQAYQDAMQQQQQVQMPQAQQQQQPPSKPKEFEFESRGKPSAFNQAFGPGKSVENARSIFSGDIFSGESLFKDNGGDKSLFKSRMFHNQK